MGICFMIGTPNETNDDGSGKKILRLTCEVGEDDADRARKELEEKVKVGTAKVDEIVSKKETDILEV